MTNLDVAFSACIAMFVQHSIVGNFVIEKSFWTFASCCHLWIKRIPSNGSFLAPKVEYFLYIIVQCTMYIHCIILCILEHILCSLWNVGLIVKMKMENFKLKMEWFYKLLCIHCNVYCILEHILCSLCIEVSAWLSKWKWNISNWKWNNLLY